MDKIPEDHEKPETLYRTLLSKYIAVWLWSIHFGALSGVVLSLVAYRSPDTHWRAFAVLSTLVIGTAILAALFSWLALYHGLVHYLIPQFILNKDADEIAFAICLRRAMVMLIIASIARVSQIFIEMSISVLTGL